MFYHWILWLEAENTAFEWWANWDRIDLDHYE